MKKRPPFLPTKRPERTTISFVEINNVCWCIYLGQSMGVDMNHSTNDIHEFVQWNLGLLTQFISGETNTMTTDEFFNHLEESYGFPICEMKGGVINLETGVYSYKGDTDLYPIAQVNLGNKTVLLYAYSIIALIDKNISDPNNIAMISGGLDIGATVKIFRMD